MSYKIEKIIFKINQTKLANDVYNKSNKFGHMTFLTNRMKFDKFVKSKLKTQ